MGEGQRPSGPDLTGALDDQFPPELAARDVFPPALSLPEEGGNAHQLVHTRPTRLVSRGTFRQIGDRLPQKNDP